MKLKTSLHFHTKDDPSAFIDYTFEQSVDYLSSLGFEVLALTCHHKVVYSKEYAAYATAKNILLIPGVELSIENKHVVALNCDKSIEKVKDFSGLKSYKKEHPEIFLLAAHPYFPSPTCLNQELEKNIELFDAVEFSWFYSKKINFNKKADALAKNRGLPFIATPDAHFLDFVDKSYAVVETEEKNISAVLKSLKQGNFQNVSSPRNFLKDMLWKWGIFTLKEEILEFRKKLKS